MNRFACTAVALGAAALLLAPAPSRAQDTPAFQRAVSLATAVMTNDTVAARRILATGLDVNTPLSNERTVLMTAAAWGRVALARELLERGADPLLENADGNTAREIALREGHRDVAALLEAAERGDPLPAIRVNTSGKSNFEMAVSLALAASQGDLREVERILATGLDPNFRISGGRTPLFTAAANGQLEVVRRLLAAGADPKVENDEHKTARDAALAWGHADVASALAQAMGLAEPARRRREPPPRTQATTQPTAPQPAAAPATTTADVRRPASASPEHENTTLAPDEFKPTGVKPRAGLWRGTVSNAGAGQWKVAFRVAPSGDITEVQYDGDIRCSSGTVGTGGEYGRSEGAGYVTRGARIALQDGAFNGKYGDAKARVHWHLQGRFTSPTTADAKVRIGAGGGSCDTWGLKFAATRVGA